MYYKIGEKGYPAIYYYVTFFAFISLFILDYNTAFIKKIPKICYNNKKYHTNKITDKKKKVIHEFDILFLNINIKNYQSIKRSYTMSKLTAAERLLKNEEQLKKLSEQRKQLLNAIKEENEQKFKDIGIKIIKAVETNEQFKIDFLNLVKEHNIGIEF